VEEHAPRCVAEKLRVHFRTAAEQITPIGWYPLWTPRATPIAISDSRWRAHCRDKPSNVTWCVGTVLSHSGSGLRPAGNPRCQVYCRL